MSFNKKEGGAKASPSSSDTAAFSTTENALSKDKPTQSGGVTSSATHAQWGAGSSLTAASEALTSSPSKKVGLVALIAFVVSAMVGGGVFNLPADSGKAASPGGLLIAWALTAFGIWFLANTFRILADTFPQLENGIFTYAKEGFGRIVGFLSAFGYWISNTFVLIVYSVLITQTLARFLPNLFSDASGSFTWFDVAFSIVLMWIFFLVANQGVKQSAILNVAGTIGKLIPILLAIVVLVLGFKASLFVSAFWGLSQAGVPLSFSWEGLGPQIGQTMMITLFLFTGIEGAVVISGQARNQRDVARATVLGFLTVLILYALVSILPLGVYAASTVQGMQNPSLAVIVDDAFPLWGSALVNAGIIISVLSTGLVKLNMLGEMPLFGARAGLFPQRFDSVNRRGAPTFAYACTMALATVLIVLVHFLSGNTWQTVINITNIMALPSYFLSCLFLWKVAFVFKGPWWEKKSFSRRAAFATGLIGTLFSLYLIYASGPRYLLIACFFYMLGIPLLLRGQSEKRKKAEKGADNNEKAEKGVKDNLTAQKMNADDSERTKEGADANRTVEESADDNRMAEQGADGKDVIKTVSCLSAWEIAFLGLIAALGIVGVVYSAMTGLFG